MMLEFFTEISKYVNVLLMIVFAISGLYAVLNKKIIRRLLRISTCGDCPV